MKQILPHTIENCTGEKITFHELVPEADGNRLIVSNEVAPGNGPLMHTHFLQDESLTVLEGLMGYQVQGGPERFAKRGESVLFKRGEAHRFWNAGMTPLRCTGYIKPANTIVFFLSAVYAAQKKTGSAKPEAFDAAYLLTRYAAEYRLNGIPWVVRKIIFPLMYGIGMLLGKYKQFGNAPKPVKA